MTIQTMDKAYAVIKYVESGNLMDRYICRETGDGETYIVISIKDKNLIIRAMDYFIESANNKTFTDFVSYFTSDEHLHLVFKYYEGITLEEKMTLEVSTLKERLELADSLIKQMTLQSMPEYFQYNCLKKESIVVTSQTECFFSYHLENLSFYKKYDLNDVLNRLSTILMYIFDEEVSKHKIKELYDFIRKVNTGSFESYIDVYKEYRKLKEYIEGLNPEDIIVPKTWIFRLWEKTKKAFKIVRKIIVVALLVIASIYLIHTISQSMNAGNEQKVFERIGTLEIQNDDSGQVN